MNQKLDLDNFERSVVLFAENQSSKSDLRDKAINTNKNVEKKNVGIVSYFESKSPEMFLKALSKSNVIASSDKTIIKVLQNNYEFSDGVINVLLHFVLKTSNSKLTKTYVEKIASQWKRKKIKTVEDALNFIKNSDSSKTSYSNKKKDIVPKWMEEESNSKNVSKSKDSNEKESVEDMMKDILEMEKKFRN